MIKTFRLRLTAWYVGFFSLMFVAFTLFLYGVLSKALRSQLDETLASQANTAATLLPDEIQEVHGDVAKAAAEVVSDMNLRASRIAIFAGDRLLASSARLSRLELTTLTQYGGNAPEAALALPYSGVSGSRAAVRRITAEGHAFSIVAIQPLDSIAADLRAVRRAVLLALPLLLGLAALGGYLFASRSLAPLGWMAEQAHKISGSNLESRLEIGDAAQELKMLAASFNELLARLDQSFATMRRFVADASHELRTPVSVIRGEADVALSQERPASEYKESLRIVLDESRRLSRLIGDLLNLARADAGHFQLQTQEFYLNELLTSCCRSVQAQATARAISLECRCADDVQFRGDEELLRRLVVNLLDNAIRYTPPGGKVWASLEAQGAEVRIRVADTGAGISPDAAGRVFERFYRADQARSRQLAGSGGESGGGFGLGLAIVKWIAESHRGAVDLASRPGAGSTFTVTLPR